MKIVSAFTRGTITVLIILLTVILVYSLLELTFIIGRSIITNHAAFTYYADTLDRNHLFLGQVQGLISAILLLTILIELIHSLVEYLKVGSSNYVTVITEIALIAIVRHLLAIDFEHTSSTTLLGLSSLIFVLGLFYLATTNRILKTQKNTGIEIKSEKL